MSLKITHKYSTAAGTPPASGDIDVGEIAINTADAELYTKDNAGNIRKFQNTTTGTSDGVQFTQSGTGAVQRTVESKLQETVSVLDFGAVGDGTTDDTAAFQAAIDNCGGRVVVPAGEYPISSTLTIPYGVLIDGVAKSKTSLAGSTTQNNSAIIRFSGTSDCFVFTGSSDIPGNDGFGVSNLSIQLISVSNAGSAIKVQASGNANSINWMRCINLNVENVSGGGNWDYGLFIDGGNVDPLGIRNCFFSDIRIVSSATSTSGFYLNNAFNIFLTNIMINTGGVQDFLITNSSSIFMTACSSTGIKTNSVASLNIGASQFSSGQFLSLTFSSIYAAFYDGPPEITGTSSFATGIFGSEYKTAAAPNTHMFSTVQGGDFKVEKNYPATDSFLEVNNKTDYGSGIEFNNSVGFLGDIQAEATFGNPNASFKFYLRDGGTRTHKIEMDYNGAIKPAVDDTGTLGAPFKSFNHAYINEFTMKDAANKYRTVTLDASGNWVIGAPNDNP